jgi:thioredoxin-related protein
MFSRKNTRLFLGLVATVLVAATGADRSIAQERTFLSSSWTDLRWRTDYNAARKEAVERGLPLLIDFGTPDCFYCKKLDAVTFRDPRVANLMNQRFILLKIDAERELHLTNQLRVQAYPTLVLAEPNGKILKQVEGYKEPQAFYDILQEALANVQPPESMTQDYQTALQHVQQRNYAAALPLLRSVAADSRGPQLQGAAQKYVDAIEKQAGEQMAAARDLESKGRIQDALEAFENAARNYPGTEATRQTMQTVARLKESAADRAGAARIQRARDLLVQAREFQKQNELVLVVDRCAILTRDFADLPEAQEAGLILGSLKNNPVQLQQAADALGERLGEMYLALAETHLKKGQPQRAEYYFQRVVLTCPGSRQAESAQVRLTQIQSIAPRPGGSGLASPGSGLTSANESK